jgi:hypothetical protein
VQRVRVLGTVNRSPTASGNKQGGF